MAEIVAIVPARGGSKGVPGKNKRPVGGKPLVLYTLEAARAATRLTRTVVTTDDPDIAALARDFGAEIVMRPAAIAEDTSPVMGAVRHALDTLRQQHQVVADGVVLLQPTSPFRAPADIDAAIALFLANGKTPVCSVYACEDNHPARMYRIEGGRLVSLMPELSSVRRQDLPPVYHRNGSMYVFGQREVASGTIIGDAMQPYLMSLESSVNIDTELDLLLMAAILERAGEDPAA